MVPAQPKIYHIVHVDRVASILASQGLLCDAQIIAQIHDFQNVHRKAMNF